MATKAEKAYMDRVAQIGCILDRHIFGTDVPAEIHHLFRPEERSNWLVVPLCPDHHRGPGGFHGLGGEPGFRRRYKLGEVEMLAFTIQALNGG